ncbi:MAG: HAMP domain-containing histidine kinase [Verrucomicrobia subdivision 3 bacterium]|nr:HAMP domain-containing histidine kinase [Limisphaerales bacterium]
MFLLAVFVPSLVLAWLAMRSLRDQQFALEHQRTLLYQGAAESIARDILAHLDKRRRDFGAVVDKLIANQKPRDAAPDFDARLREAWPLVEIGFVVGLEGEVLAPSLFGGPAARRFRLENDRFLCSRETVEVIWESPKGPISLSKLDAKELGKTPPDKAVFATKSGSPANQAPASSTGPAEFRQLIGDSTEGTLARFLQNRLNVMFWRRPESDRDTVFGAQVNTAQLTQEMTGLVRVEPGLAGEIVVALLNDQGRPVSTTRSGFDIAGRTPAVSREIGEVLPHWELAVFLADPSRLGHSARALQRTVGFLVALLVVAIGVGGWLIVNDLRRQLALARQKTDFVSNVSHELKTPLTSIRMFSELLAEGRVQDPARQRHFLQIITAETARLTRLINNVLDFARLERGEKKYQFQNLDLAALTRETVETYRPHLEENGFKLRADLPSTPLPVTGDRDALAQVIVNLISNAEKYGGDSKEIDVSASARNGAVCVSIMDRGAGVPPGCQEKIFEQFFRAHDSLSSGIQGSGLGLTLARQIARAHGGDVTCAPREGGGSCFNLNLALKC